MKVASVVIYDKEDYNLSNKLFRFETKYQKKECWKFLTGIIDELIGESDWEPEVYTTDPATGMPLSLVILDGPDGWPTAEIEITIQDL